VKRGKGRGGKRTKGRERKTRGREEKGQRGGGNEGVFAPCKNSCKCPCTRQLSIINKCVS